LEDPLDVPAEVVDFYAGQLGIENPSCVKPYTERDNSWFDHAWKIRQACELKEFAEAEPGLRKWVAARSWTSGDGPKAIFTDAVRWLRERDVLLPGVTTLARLVTNVREETTQRLWKMLESLLTAGQRYVLDQLLEVPPGARVSDLERWRTGSPPRGSGPSVIKALDQVAEAGEDPEEAARRLGPDRPQLRPDGQVRHRAAAADRRDRPGAAPLHQGRPQAPGLPRPGGARPGRADHLRLRLPCR
jgi:Domain of unknown function (DUF4158)